ncbi:MAG: PAS domain-containing protein [Rhodobacteraceae bacterium]|nr:PAS domain-containing protein [Paracoccaceae bacterium]
MNTILPINKAGVLALESPANQASLAYWQQQRAGRIMPSRADLSPADMLVFLPNVILLDVLQDPIDFRYRLIGTKVTLQMMFSDHTGKTMRELSELGQGPGSQIFGNCQRAVETFQPVTAQTPYIGKNSDFKATEDVIMPLSEDGKTVNMLFITAEFVDS